MSDEALIDAIRDLACIQPPMAVGALGVLLRGLIEMRGKKRE